MFWERSFKRLCVANWIIFSDKYFNGRIKMVLPLVGWQSTCVSPNSQGSQHNPPPSNFFMCHSRLYFSKTSQICTSPRPQIWGMYKTLHLPWQSMLKTWTKPRGLVGVNHSSFHPLYKLSFTWSSILLMSIIRNSLSVAKFIMWFPLTFLQTGLTIHGTPSCCLSTSLA